ncbi:MAG: dipeptide/oligopeptide/nickel ABC transporter permease/ATP-binding protein [Alkalispirochaeta sp.]
MSSSSKLRRFFYNRLATVGLIVVLAVIAISVMAPILPLADPNTTELQLRMVPPGSDERPLGADELGRDMLSRLIWGLRVSLAVGISATAIAAVIGSLIGIFSAFYGGILDNTLMRGVDMLMAFPYMLLALSIVAVLGPGLFNALIAISIVNIPFFARNVRGATVGLVRLEYVDAARLSGKSDLQILFGELLPNVLPVIFITISTTVGWMILETAGLSFLGLGAQPPTADLGSMLGEGRKSILTAPHVATLPGLVILVLVIGINLLGDGLRDVLDPYLRSGALVSPQPATAVEGTLRHRLDRPQKVSAPDASAAGSGASSQPPLEVDQLQTWFWQQQGRRSVPVHAADGVSFQVERGRALGIMGESGSGKSVTALSVLGLVPTPPGRIMNGSIRYYGEELIGAHIERLRHYRGNRIAYIFQNPMTSLNPLISVGEQIAESVRYHQGVSRGAARARALELMHKVQIPDPEARLDSFPHELSGGMRQRIGIAMALANDPDVIIADEPTTALDVTIQAQILKLLDSLRQSEGVALVFISHDFGVISEICDRVVVMYAGQVVESGTVDEIYRRPLHPYTRRLMECVPRLGERSRTLAAIPGLPPALDDLPRGCRFADRCDVVMEQCRAEPVALRRVGDREARCVRVEGRIEGRSV